MLQNITLNAEKNLIEKARKQFRENKTTLNAEFRRRPVHYIETPRTGSEFALPGNGRYRPRSGENTGDSFDESLILSGVLAGR